MYPVMIVMSTLDIFKVIDNGLMKSVNSGVTVIVINSVF